MMSVPPPGVKPTSTRTERDGYGCAAAVPTRGTKSSGSRGFIVADLITPAMKVAIVGAGMGGLAAAAALSRNGMKVDVYEQAGRFARIGAGIQMLPNSMKVLRGLGIEARLRGFAFAPRSHLNREWDTGEVRAELPMPESRYDAPYLCMHRGDLHDALLSAVFSKNIF